MGSQSNPQRSKPGKIDSSAFENAEKKFLESGGEFREFRIGDLFEIRKVYGKPVSSYPEGKYPFVTGSKDNNGVIAYIEAPKGAISEGNCIAVDPITGYCYYQPKDFVGRGFSGASINLLYNKKLNERRALYICSAIEKISTKIASYTSLFNNVRMPDTKIQLPVEKSGEIAFNYMEERIKELEHGRIKELEAYLQATGLRDYQLSAEENRVLAEFNDLIENPHTHTHTHTHRLMKFKMGDIFEFKAVKQARSQKEIPTDNSKNGVPYVVQSLFNNMFSRNVNRDWLIEHNETPIAGNRIVLGVTLPAVSYWEKEFGASQVITATSSWMNQKTGLFAATAISKLMVLFSYSQKPGIEIYKNLEITLPSIKESSNPDFEFMETFIRAVEKLAIADVVKWLDAQIEATKQVVSRG